MEHRTIRKIRHYNKPHELAAGQSAVNFIWMKKLTAMAKQARQTSIKAIQTALDLGINFY